MRVVIIPKIDAAVASLSFAATELKPAARQSQIRQLQKIRDSAASKSETRITLQALRDHGAGGGRNGGVRNGAAAQVGQQLPVTGVIIAEADEGTIAKLKADLPQHTVVADYRLSLIPPVRSRKAAARTASNVDTWHLAATKLQQARSQGFAGRGEGITVAILDTGIAKVSELRGRIDGMVTLDVDRNTWTKSAATRDTDGHGTHVAGLVCGANVGVAPAAKVVNVLMIPEGNGNLSDFILAMEYAAQEPSIAIMNISAGIQGMHMEMQGAVNAVRAVGVLPVIAIGNEGRNKSRSPGNYAEAFSVGASTVNGKVASFSGGGMMTIDGMTFPVPDLVAPGEGVYSCVMTGGYEAWDGTSMATPIVSGLAALVIEKFPDILLPDLEQLLLGACVKLNAPDDRQGAGLAQLPSVLWMPARYNPASTVRGAPTARHAAKRPARATRVAAHPANRRSATRPNA